MPQQVWVDVMRLVTFTKIRTRIEGLNAHFPHVALDSFAVDPEAELHIIDVITDAPGASRRFFGMDPVDQMFDLDFLFGWLGILPVKICPIQGE